MKPLFTRLSLFSLLWLSAFAGFGQSLAVDVAPRVICLGGAAQITALLNGVNASDIISCTIYPGTGDSIVLNTGTPVTTSSNFQYIAAGVYNVRIVITLKGHIPIENNLWDTVYNLPVSNFSLTTLDSQCFTNNYYGYLNSSAQGAFPSLPLSGSYLAYGDGDSAVLGATGSAYHNFTIGNSLFFTSVKTTDVGGCYSKVFKTTYVAPDLNAHFQVNGIPKCDTSCYIFNNLTPLSASNFAWFKWYFDDGTYYFSSSPVVPADIAHWGTFTHCYTKNGVFNPSLVVKHKKYNCIDSFVYSQSGSQLPENIVLRYDIRSRRTTQNDTIADSVCNDNLNVASLCLYNMYPLQGINTPIQILWDFADPNANPPGSDKKLNETTPCYKYQGMGQYFPTLRIGCPGKPPKLVNFWSRIDTAKLSDSQYVPPPITNPILYTVNGYLFQPNDQISQYRQIYATLPGTVIVTAADGSTEIFTVPGHLMANGDMIRFSDTGSVTGLRLYNDYYIITATTNTFQLALTKNGLPVNIGTLITPFVTPLFSRLDPVLFDSIVRYWKWFNDDVDKINYRKKRADLQGFGVNIMGPKVQVEDPPVPVLMKKYLKMQCGPDLPVEFTNATNLYQSNNLFIRWDFADDYAPKCTSYSVPDPGKPPGYPGGCNGCEPYTTANDMFNRTLGRFIVNGVIYPGRVNCNFSHDTLPIHQYEKWTNVLRWYKYGHDFPPFDTVGWTKDYSITTKKHVPPQDTLNWGKPIFSAGPTAVRIDTIPGIWPADMNPNRTITLTNDIPDPIGVKKGYWNAVIGSGHVIDTSNFISPNDLSKLPNGTLRRYRGNTPTGLTGHPTLYDYFFQRAVEKCYTVSLNMKDSFNNQSDDPYKEFTRIDMVSGKIVIQQYSTRVGKPPVINSSDTFSYTSTPPSIVNDTLIYNYKPYPVYTEPGTGIKYILRRNDEFFVDYFDCGKTATIQLPLTGIDALGLGFSGKMCPGLFNGISGGNPKIHFDNSGFVDEAQQVKAPGTLPACNQRTYLLFNYDSMLDRHDNTPCALDGFVDYQGKSPLTGTTVTPGGKTFPLFYLQSNFPAPPPTHWSSASGAINYTHYNPSLTAPQQYSPMPFDRRGFTTVGVIAGTGCATFACTDPACLSDTVWYHNFMQFITLDASFTYHLAGGYPAYGNPSRLPSNDYLYDTTKTFFANNPAPPPPIVYIQNGAYREPWSRLYGKGDIVEVVPYTPIQDYVLADIWDWGDGIVTIDSFYTNIEDTFVHLDPINFPNDSSFFEKRTYPKNRIRYEFNTETFPWTIISQTIPYPMGVHVNSSFYFDTIWQCQDNIHALLPQSVTRVNVLIDTAFFLKPVQHRYVKSSWEMLAGPGSPVRKNEITLIQHNVMTTTKCANTAGRYIVIGVMDTFLTWNKYDDFGNRILSQDNVLCVGEELNFYDSIRYWFPFSNGTHNPSRPLLPGMYPLLFGNNGSVTWGSNMHGTGMSGWPMDTIKTFVNFTKFYSVLGSGPSSCPYGWQDYTQAIGGIPFNFCIKIDTVFYERVLWDWESDGVIDWAGCNAKHKFDKPGRFKISMISRDTVGYFDTCSMLIDVVQPMAKFTSKTFLLCSDPTIFNDSSYVIEPGTVQSGIASDQVKGLRWWFGDIGYGPNDFRSTVKNPFYPYRNNGWYKVQEAIVTEQGCVDTFRKDIFIAGPRPRIKLLSDTFGCNPYTVKVLCYPNDSGAVALTGSTQIFSGRKDHGWDVISTKNPDTIYITYNAEGIYYISAIGYDKYPPSMATCPPVYLPDTVGGFERPIRIFVKNPYKVQLETSKEIVCVGEQFKISNLSSFDTITRFRMYAFRADTIPTDTLFKTNFVQDTAFKYVLTSPGLYSLILHSTRVIPGSPYCESFDTVHVTALKAKADLQIDSIGVPKYNVWNRSDSSHANGYIWRIYNPDGGLRTEYIVPDNQSPLFHLGVIDFKNDTGIFKVCIVVATSGVDNCRDSVCKNISNNFITEITIPNVFTPNGDNINDLFNVKIKGEELFELKIWNRWGGVVFESTDAKVQWNGKTHNKGDDNPEGTYYFVLKYRLRAHDEQTVRGSITLIRD